MTNYYNEPQSVLSFPVEYYEHSTERSNHGSSTNPNHQYGAVKPPLSLSRTCLPNTDGEYRPYKIFTDVETYVESASTYYYLGATACPRFLKCSECPLR